MKTNDDKQRRLGALTREMDDVRTGRSIRRRATFGLAAVALVATAAWTVRPSGRTAPAIESRIVQMEPPEATGPASNPMSMPKYNSIRVVRTSPTASLRHVEIIDDAGLARALRASGTRGGVARVGGRVILMGSLAKERERTPEPNAGPEPSVM